MLNAYQLLLPLKAVHAEGWPLILVERAILTRAGPICCDARPCLLVYE